MAWWQKVRNFRFQSRAAAWAVWIGIVVVILGVVLGVLKVYTLADQAHRAICALRAERIKGVQEGEKFLKKHPNGLVFRDDTGKKIHISRADMVRSVETQKETVKAFRFADC